MKAKKNFFKEMKLAGALADIKYSLTHAIGKGTTGVTLTSKQAGHTIKAVGDSASMLTSVSAQGSASVGGVDVVYEPAYQLKKKLSKVTLSAALGGGVSATGVVTATNAGAFDADCELGYESSLGEVRDRECHPWAPLGCRVLCFAARANGGELHFSASLPSRLPSRPACVPRARRRVACCLRRCARRIRRARCRSSTVLRSQAPRGWRRRAWQSAASRALS